MQWWPRFALTSTSKCLQCYPWFRPRCSNHGVRYKQCCPPQMNVILGGRVNLNVVYTMMNRHTQENKHTQNTSKQTDRHEKTDVYSIQGKETMPGIRQVPSMALGDGQYNRMTSPNAELLWTGNQLLRRFGSVGCAAWILEVYACALTHTHSHTHTHTHTHTHKHA
jgi:hypothetical protein